MFKDEGVLEKQGAAALVRRPKMPGSCTREQVARNRMGWVLLALERY